MWRRLSSSLTVRIFLITTALLIATCALTYGSIAYLTPISYTTLLEDELAEEIDALVIRLEDGVVTDGEEALLDFMRRTGADAQLHFLQADELYYGHIDFEQETQIVEDNDLYYGSADSYQETTVVQDVYYLYNDDNESQKELPAQEDYLDVEAADTDSVYTSVAAGTADLIRASESSREFFFQDGQHAVLTVSGGLRAVNRTTEAMLRVLPWLSLALILFSFAGSFFYARFITRPIVRMSSIASRIANLDFNARWTYHRQDEIGTLGESLNQLSDNLSGTLNDLHNANAALKKDIERERELERQRMAFFSATSHELKTPVTILKGQLSGMLAQVGVYQDREKYLARALEVVNRMESLIRQILTISRIESRSTVLESEHVDLGALLYALIEQDTELMQQRSLSLTSDIDTGVILRGNEKLLSSALDNVLMNAILYSSPGAAIRVELSENHFCIENSGAHIDKDALSHVFEPFYRVEQSRNRKTGGSGLGLYLVRSILDLHGADCRIENTDKGVRFTALFRDDHVPH